MSVTRGWVIGVLAFAMATSMVLPGCSNKSAEPVQAAAASDGAEPAEGAGAVEGEESTEEAEPAVKPRKGRRVSGGLPPIRRADLTSGLRVPGAQRFVLGGGQSSSFFCDVVNEGTTTVLVSAGRNGGYTVIAKLEPGDSASHRFQPTESAVIANLSPIDEARLRVRVWGDTNLGMGYESNAD